MIYVFDIDGTICTNTHGDYKNAKSYKKRVEKVNQLYDEGNVIYFATARGMGRSNNNIDFAYEELYLFTKDQLDSWGVKYHHLFMGKPNGDIFVDDKGMKDEDFFNEGTK
jgi:hypothetical protein